MSSATSSSAGIESLQDPLVGMQVFLLVIGLLMCILRIQSRLVIVRSLGPDDYIMIAATLFSIGLVINNCVGSTYGWGLHMVDVLPQNYSNILVIGWVAQILFTITTTLMKLSILTFYLRLATTKTYRRVIYGTIIWHVLWCIAFLLVVIFQCNPISAFWIPSHGNQNPKCINSDPALLVNGITNILNDLFVYFLPMPMLWRVQLPKRQRIGLIVLFSIGALVNIAGGLRLYYSIVVNDSRDGTWPGFQLWTWEAVEVNLGIACACAPAVKPLLMKWFPKAMHGVFGTNTATNPSRQGLSAGANGPFVEMKNQRGGREMGGAFTGVEQGSTRTHVYAGKLGPHELGESEESLTDHSFLGALESKKNVMITKEIRFS